MTADELIGRLDGVRRTSRGWTSKCPAHADRHPSLSIREGERGLLLKCWAGCTLAEILTALNLTVADLFYETRACRKAWRRLRQQQPWRFDWRRTAALLEDHALTLWLRAESVLASAKNMQTPKWTDEDFDTAVNTMSRAYTDIERSEFLEGVAFDLRLQGLKKEQEQYASRSRVA